MWEQEQKLMFCDVSILEPDVRMYVLAMRASKMAAFNGGYGDTSSNGGDSSGDGNGGNI